jgi:hypothetical protein
MGSRGKRWRCGEADLESAHRVFRQSLVLRVKLGNKSVHFIGLCEDQRACPFTVVVLPSDLQDVAGVTALKAARLRFTLRQSFTTGGPRSS